ncbi:Transcription factor DIVARICATA [Acorus calamus]|uniref:Transcription factor MYBS1 n=1 Tax=Acorus calamus TaxID=4465 RepID=A0AAV9ECG5_ACOCL|nr:Transcription factor DIVARICATA [Acorus calamus]
MYRNYAPLPPPQTSSPPPHRKQWTVMEQKMFEGGLAMYLDGTADGWRMIAAGVPGRSVEEVLERYESLVREVEAIESGRVDGPRYSDEEESCEAAMAMGVVPTRGRNSRGVAQAEERKKGTPWTEEEHRRFLEGLEKYGKGDWRSISRNSVVSRTPTQVASHAQKYFLRQSAEKKDKKRSSIHDITNP